MPIRHALLAILVVFIWGCNFIFIRICLNELSPLFLCAMRFFLASVPAIFFIKLPNISIKLVIIYGLMMFGLQFALLFMGMKAGMTPGLAALLSQVQIFFSIFFAALFFDEIPTFSQVVGCLVAFAGIGLIALHFNHHTVSLAGFLLIIAATVVWGAGNLLAKLMKKVNMISLVVWGSFFAFFPLLLSSYLFEGTAQIVNNMHQVTLGGFASLLYIVFASTWVGYGVWGWLISQYPVAVVVPYTLLVPIFGMLSSYWVLGESLESWKIASAVLVIGGLCINIFGTRLFAKRKQVIHIEKIVTE